MKDNWNSDVYSQFLGLRTRPAKDLLAAVPEGFESGVLYDLGCGPGNSTALLKNRWPGATVIGVDSSADMLDKAKSQYANMHFLRSDIQHFNVDQPAQLIFSNAALQWVNNHQCIMPKLVSMLSAGGVLAIQMPNNFHQASHQATVQILQQHQKWAHLQKHLIYGALSQPQYQPGDYYDLLSAAGLTDLQLWQTEYYQEVENHQAIFDWVIGTSLRPALLEMSDADRQEFTDLYVQLIAQAYPIQENGKVLFGFQRFFIVGVKASG